MPNFSTTTPWEQRGVKVDYRRQDGRDWHDIWPEIDEGIDPISAACDFYLLEAIVCGSIFDVAPAVPDLSVSEQDRLLDLLGIHNTRERNTYKRERFAYREAQIQNDPRIRLAEMVRRAALIQENLIMKLDESFVGYLHMACAGEVRHHKAVGNRVFNPGNRESAWCGWRDIYEQIGNQGLLDIEEMFLEFGSDTAYGGEKWAAVTKVLYMRLEKLLGPTDFLNKKLFVDRVFSLQHNGGCVLNKLEWTHSNSLNLWVQSMQTVLDMHGKDTPDVTGMARLSSETVRKFFVEFLKAGTDFPLRPGFKKSVPELIEAIDFDGYSVCGSCGSDFTRGHNFNCNYFSYLSGDPGMKWNADGTAKHHSEYARIVWEITQTPGTFKYNDYPIDAKGQPAIDGDTKLEIHFNFEYNDGPKRDVYTQKSEVVKCLAKDFEPVNCEDITGYSAAEYVRRGGYSSFYICVGGYPDTYTGKVYARHWTNAPLGNFGQSFIKQPSQLEVTPQQAAKLASLTDPF